MNVNPQMETERKERASYALMAFSTTLLSVMPMYFLLYFYTEIFLLQPAALALMMLLGRIWDAFNDVLLGHVMSNTSSRHGTFRPFILWFAIPGSIFTALMFFTPGLSGPFRLVYAYATYFIWNFFNSGQVIAVNSLLPVITKSRRERTYLNSLRVVSSITAVAGVSLFTLKITDFLGRGDNKAGFFGIALILGFAAAIMQLAAFKGVKERHGTERREKLPARKALSHLVSDKGLLLIFGMYMANWIANTFKNQSTAYYMKYVLEREDCTGTFLLAGMLASIAAQPLIKKTADKIGAINSIAAGTAVSLVAMLTMAFFGQNLTGLFVINILFGIASAFPANLIFIVMADFTDALSARHRFNLSGWVYSTLNFLVKLGAGVGEALIALLLFVCGYYGGVKYGFFVGTSVSFAVSLTVLMVYMKREKRQGAEELKRL